MDFKNGWNNVIYTSVRFIKKENTFLAVDFIIPNLKIAKEGVFLF